MAGLPLVGCHITQLCVIAACHAALGSEFRVQDDPVASYAALVGRWSSQSCSATDTLCCGESAGEVSDYDPCAMSD